MISETNPASNADKKDGSPERLFIPAKAKFDPFTEGRIFKACAYCRVSTDSDMQLSSFELQTEHYQNLAGKHKNWDLRKIYADDSDIFEPSQKALMNQAVFMIWSNFLSFWGKYLRRCRMGYIFAASNFKGGCGKTTTVLNLGAALSTAEKSVLLIDGDAQGSLTAALGYTPAEQPRTLSNLLLAAIDYPEDLELHLQRAILRTDSGVDLIPANRHLADAAARL